MKSYEEAAKGSNNSKSSSITGNHVHMIEEVDVVSHVHEPRRRPALLGTGRGRVEQGPMCAAASRSCWTGERGRTL